ncbi:MAG: hypothetical protein JWQ64_1915 [Subtercola sp.]|nr:hypothetical protein [Subtercola sp.]
MRNVLHNPLTAARRENLDEPPLPEPAYAVPLRVDRSAAPRYRLFNVGHEQLIGLTCSLLGSGVMNNSAPLTLDVGAQTDITIRGDDLARRTVLVVRWFRPSGEEYLWRVSF